MDLTEWNEYDGCLYNYNCTEWLVKNKAANAPITFEEIG